MAFHVACPITCHRICFCPLGFPSNHGSGNDFLEQVTRLEEFLNDPLGIRVPDDNSTIQVLVPKVIPSPPPPPQPLAPAIDDEVAAASAQTKRAALQRKAAAAMVAAEDYARRFESGDLEDASRGQVGEEQVQSNVNVLCRICFFGENEGSERARRMLPCKSCGKKYHRNCLKTWARNRDLFHWSSWTCPSCRICEVCRRTGQPHKFMFCKRCDGAYHCYCLIPPHKNVSSGPYLCTKHSRCHSCGSNVPGNGLSVRWFLGYTCCDACGRLFVKGNYCPVCLKVYRDSETTPMVCCDVCQRWVHCHCDGISDEKYLQFQVDGNLQYKCAACRGECYQVKDLEDAVKELWKRRDKADRTLIASLRTAAGLPSQEEIFSISPYSDDEENGPVTIKKEYGRSFKLSLKGLADKSPQKIKDNGKKSSNKTSVKKKGYQALLTNKTELKQVFEGQTDAQTFGYTLADGMNEEMSSHRIEEPDTYSSPLAGSLGITEEICPINQPGVLKHKFVDEVMVHDENRTPRVVRIKSNNRSNDFDGGEDSGKQTGKLKAMKGKKLVINFGARKINVSSSPRSDSSTGQREQELRASNGTQDTNEQRTNENFVVDRHDGSATYADADGTDYSGQLKGLKVAGREGNFIKLGKNRSGVCDYDSRSQGDTTGVGYETATLDHTNVSLGRSGEVNRNAFDCIGESPVLRNGRDCMESMPDSSDDNVQLRISQSLPKDSKPLLKLKFKKPNIENQDSSQLGEEKSYIKGQRSKRKRPSPFIEKMPFSNADDVSQSNNESVMDDEIMDANWILKKLGKDATGKRVEVQQSSDNSWHKGVVTEVIEGTSRLSVTLDEGGVRTLELGKVGVRFVPQKQKRCKT